MSTSQVSDVAYTKETKVSSSSQTEEVLTNKNLEVILEKFSKESDPKNIQTPFQMNITQTPKVTRKTSFTVEASKEPMDANDSKIIQVFLTSKVVLKVEEIPLDLFYSLKHKAAINR